VLGEEDVQKYRHAEHEDDREERQDADPAVEQQFHDLIHVTPPWWGAPATGAPFASFLASFRSGVQACRYFCGFERLHT
jgi:hypothetical protein